MHSEFIRGWTDKVNRDGQLSVNDDFYILI